MKSNEAKDHELPSISKLDKTIHEPARLLIMAHLFVVESADFLFLQRQTQMTPGNLSAHLSKLEDAGFKIEGIVRKRIFIRGKWRDELLCSILREEWKEPKVLGKATS